MKNVANVNNDGNLKGYYPLVLGDDLGFADTTAVTYPEIEEWYQDQLSQFWRPEEFSLAQDKSDLRECPVSERDIMIKNLMAQWLLDSVASRSILETLGPFVSNTELQSALTAQTMFEDIHARSYSLIARQTFADPNKVIEDAKRDHAINYRSEIIGKQFNEINKLGSQYNLGREMDKDHMGRTVLKTFVALLGLEAISFMASFACTFALTETGRFQGISNIVTAIIKDEKLHAKLDVMILNRLLNTEGYRQYLNEPETKQEIADILNAVVQQELRWSEYVFEEGRRVLGLNEVLLKEYVYYLSAPVFDWLGVEWNHQRVTTNPLPYMSKYEEPDMIQSAAQEIELTNYRIADMESDVSDDDEFDF